MDFQFLPKELTARCSQLIKAHHSTNGYWDLPDLLWHEETREFIAKQANLQLVFRGASTTRRAKKAIEGYALIITVILSLEVLASDFAGWGRRFPVAKRKEVLARLSSPMSLIVDPAISLIVFGCIFSAHNSHQKKSFGNWRRCVVTIQFASISLGAVAGFLGIRALYAVISIWASAFRNRISSVRPRRILP